VPALLTCRYCHRAGFVRFEHVITKGHASQDFYCGACDRSWQIHEPEEAPQLQPPGPSKSKRPAKRSH
jgi:hypothetical protein